MLQDVAPTLSVFYCYAHEDTLLRDELDKHLAMLRKLGWIQSWSDRDISAGTDRQQALDHHLDTADLLLLLVSADFINSDYCYGVEFQHALKRHQAGDAIVIPILLRPVEWEKTPLSMLQALPRDGRSVVQWDHPDEAFKQIAMEVRTVVEALRQPVVVVALPQQQTIATDLVSFLDIHAIPTWHTEHEPEAIKLQEAIRTSSAVILIASPETHAAHLLKETQNLAAMYQRPILGAWVADTDQGEEQESTPPKVWPGTISIAPEYERQQEAFQELFHQLKLLRHHMLFSRAISSPETFVRLREPRNPYKGLRAFTADDTRDFFGRTTLVDELTRSVANILSLEKQGGQSTRLLAVVGPSGSGKSSVVLAGLLPRLRTDTTSESATWVYLDPLVPGEHPLEALALAFFEHFPKKSLQMLRDDLHDARDLHFYAAALTKQAKSASPHVVLVVDQFEELFTLTTTEQERQQFIDLLVTACTQRGGPLIVILTLRADFYDRPMRYPALCMLISAHQTLMLPMTLDDLRTAITQPATLPEVQLTFAEHLVGDLLFGIQGQVGALPLLQFTLEQLFQLRSGRQLTLSAYHEMGGVKGALSRQAEQTYQDLPSLAHRTSARILFLRLIDPGFTEQDTTRRRAAISVLTFPDATQTLHMQETFETFVKARLLTTNRTAGRTTIEVSHEAVIREWPRLADWLREARDDVRLQQTINEDAEEWVQHDKPEDRLYRGSQLKDARAWVSHNTPDSSETTFLHASLRADAARRLRYVVSVTAIIFLLLSTTGLVGWLLTRPDPTRVINLQDNNNPGSLRYAINEAPPGSKIKFDPNLHGTIQLRSGDLNITRDLTILGLDKGIISISSKSGYIVHILPRVTVTIFGLTFKDSKTTNHNFIFNDGGTLTISNSTVSGNTNNTGGGGIYGDGTLTISNSTVSGNTSSGGGGIFSGGIYGNRTLTISNSTISGNTNSGSGGGGGIYSSGTLTISNSNVSGNTSINSNTSSGGGIFSDGTMITISNSTVSGNTNSGSGGGICIQSYSPDYVKQGVQVDLMFSTIYGNTANGGGDIAIEDFTFHSSGEAKASKQISQVKIRNSIVAGDPAHPGPDIVGTLTSYGYNLFQDNSDATFDATTSKQHSTDKDLSANDLSKLFAAPVEPRDNGGPTKTLALASDSPAVDQVPLAACHIITVPSIVNNLGTPTAQYTITTDQRGVKRPDNGEDECDIGAYEYIV